jgi:hypothetical protein
MRENMNRRTFVTKGCACGALLLAGTSCGISETPESKPPKEDYTLPINPPQVMAVLTDIDGSGDKNLVDAVFTRWGRQCFHSQSGLKAFTEQQRANFQGYVDYVNGNRSRYWEKLDYDKDGGIINVTSRKFGKCPCAYAQCPQPAKALCTHCCKAFQTELFKAMTGRDVTVQIDESILLGGERCRTTVRLLARKQTDGVGDK